MRVKNEFVRIYVSYLHYSYYLCRNIMYFENNK